MKKTLLALALAGFASSAAADALIYGGAMIGQSNYDGKTSTSTEIHVGTGLLPFIGIEGGYVNHGKFDLSGGDLEASSVYAAVRPSVDIGPFHIYARAGLHRWNTEINSSKDDGINSMVGFGAEYSMLGPISLGASYHMYKMKDEDVGNFSLSATFHFL